MCSNQADLGVAQALEQRGRGRRGLEALDAIKQNHYDLVLMDCDDVDTLNAIAGRIIRRLELPMVFNTAECRISASIGITVSSFYREFDPVMMAADADAALYASKNRGRACHTFYAPAAVKGGRQGQANLARAPG